MHRTIYAPRQLPMAPRPLEGELLSSWLTRVATANSISFEELLDAFTWTFQTNESAVSHIDFDLDARIASNLAEFCRLAPNVVAKLSIARQFPGIPNTLVLGYPNSLYIPGCRLTTRARFSFCTDCLQEQEDDGLPATIPASWSLALMTHCHKHLHPLRTQCPVCFAENPLLLSLGPGQGRVRCGACAAAITGGGAPPAAPMSQFVIEIEKLYVQSLHGISPDPDLCGELSSTQFKALIESLALLFATRLPGETHILAVLTLDTETAHTYYLRRNKAEAHLAYFSWKWRFLVMLSIAKVLFATEKRKPTPAPSTQRASLFFDLLKAIPSEDRVFLAIAAEPWPEALQEPFWTAVKQVEGAEWESGKSLRFRGSPQSRH